MLKKILSISIFTFPLYACALNYNDTDFVSNKYKEYISDQLVIAIEHNNKINDNCMEKAKSSSLSQHTIDELNKLNLTDKELGPALGMFVMETHLKCVGNAQSMLIGYFNEARKLKIAKANNIVKEIDDILLDQSMLIKYRYYFAILPDDKKEKINSLDELKKPFDLMQEIVKIKTSQ